MHNAKYIITGSYVMPKKDGNNMAVWIMTKVVPRSTVNSTTRKNRKRREAAAIKGKAVYWQIHALG